jgi:hypothetical protein
MKPNHHTLLNEALAQANLAYQFAPGSYTFGALAAIANAIERMRAPDWIEEFIAYENLGSAVCVADPGRPHPASGAD